MTSTPRVVAARKFASNPDVVSRPPQALRPKLTCLHLHKLQAQQVLKPNWFCSECDEDLFVGVTIHGCRDCDFDLCDRCARQLWPGEAIWTEASSRSPGTCPALHQLSPAEVLTTTWYCSECNCRVAVGATLLGCRLCDYDICGGCAETVWQADKAPNVGSHGVESNGTPQEMSEKALALSGPCDGTVSEASTLPPVKMKTLDLSATLSASNMVPVSATSTTPRWAADQLETLESVLARAGGDNMLKAEVIRHWRIISVEALRAKQQADAIYMSDVQRKVQRLLAPAGYVVHVGDILCVRAGNQLEVEGVEYYKEQDTGVVTRSFSDASGLPQVVIQWQRTGKVTAGPLGDWQQCFRRIGYAG